MFLSQFGDSASVVHINNLRCRYLFDIENFLLHLVRSLFRMVECLPVGNGIPRE